MEPNAFGQHHIFHLQRLFQCPPLPFQSLFYAVHSSPATNGLVSCDKVIAINGKMWEIPGKGPLAVCEPQILSLICPFLSYGTTNLGNLPQHYPTFSI